MLVPCTNKEEFVNGFISECRPEMLAPRKKHPGGRPRGKTSRSKYDEAQIRRWYLEDGLSSAEIAERYGTSKGTIKDFLHRKGITRKEESDQEKTWENKKD